MKVTFEQLTQIGYSETAARELLNFAPLERLRKLQIIGNAWSDSPIFDSAHDVIVSMETTLEEKMEALTKLSHTVGVPPPSAVAPEEIQAAIVKYLL